MSLQMRWETDASRVAAFVEFFLGNVNTDYISHGEVLDGRADCFQQWSSDLPAVLALELAAGLDPLQSLKQLAVLEEDGTLRGLALIERVPRKAGDIAVLSDLVVDTKVRGAGLGATFLAWIETELSATGVHTLILESGIANTRAHAFFERRGFTETSKVLAKQL